MIAAEQSSAIALLLGLPALLIAVAGLINARISKREVQGKSEEVWMTLTKESTDMVLQRLEELKVENARLKAEALDCKRDLNELKRWLIGQGIKVPNPPNATGGGA